MSKPRLQFYPGGTEPLPPETRQTSGLAEPEGWLANVFHASAGSNSGIVVNEVTGMRFPAVYACVRLISETVAQLPLGVYLIEGDNKTLRPDHPVHNLINRRPNDEMTSFVWRDTVQGHCGSWGNGYSYIERDRLGRAANLVPLLPDRTHAYRIDEELIYLSSMNPWQRGTPLSSGDVTVRAFAEDVIHVPAFGFDGVCGYSPIRLQAEAIGVGMAAQQFGAEFFGSGAILDGVLEHPSTLKPEGREQLRREWQQNYHGKGGKRKTAILWEGMKYNRIGIPPEDAQFIETRKLSRTEVATIYNVPPHMIGDLEKATFSNITEQSIEFLRYCIAPWLQKWEQELERKLLSERELAAGYAIRFDRSILLQGTPEQQAEADKTGVLGGWINRNEARTNTGRNPRPELEPFLVPQNMALVGPDGQPIPVNSDPEPAPDTEDDARGWVFGPLVRRFAEQVVNAEKKATGDALATIIVRHIRPIAEAAAVIDDRTAAEIVDQFADAYQPGADCEKILSDILLRPINGR